MLLEVRDICFCYAKASYVKYASQKRPFFQVVYFSIFGGALQPSSSCVVVQTLLVSLLVSSFLPPATSATVAQTAPLTSVHVRTPDP